MLFRSSAREFTVRSHLALLHTQTHLRRSAAEEIFLVRFFGEEYEEYRRKVPTRILFIR